MYEQVFCNIAYPLLHHKVTLTCVLVSPAPDEQDVNMTCPAAGCKVTSVEWKRLRTHRDVERVHLGVLVGGEEHP